MNRLNHIVAEYAYKFKVKMDFQEFYYWFGHLENLSSRGKCVLVCAALPDLSS